MSATTRARFGASIVAPALLKPLDVGPARVELEVREILDEQVKRIENLGGAVAQSQVVGTDGEEFGSVTDFYIDLSQKKVPYLEVASGGLLGTLQDPYRASGRQRRRAHSSGPEPRSGGGISYIRSGGKDHRRP